jgi:hypothetical protein
MKKMSNLIGAVMLTITASSFLRSVYDHVGWRFWEIYSATQEVQESVAKEFLITFFFLNALVAVCIWAITSTRMEGET